MISRVRPPIQVLLAAVCAALTSLTIDRASAQLQPGAGALPHRDSGLSRLGGPVPPPHVFHPQRQTSPSNPLPGEGQIVGPAKVVDGDTLEIAGERIRLEGIDAPELGQTCGRAWLGQWSCGVAAQSHLARAVADAIVTCVRRGRDKYNRTLGVCFVGDRDLNAQMVESGLAWAFVRYSQAYVTEEQRAREAKRGIWVGHAIPAWDYRAQKWGTAETAQAKAPEGCVIKGAVTANGRIYHMPWSPWYDKVKIDADPRKRGDRRWFCSEAEAITAGWRPVR